MARWIGLLLVLLAPAQAIPPASEDATAIVTRSLEADNENLAVTSRYTYQEFDQTRDLDRSGEVRKTTSETRDIVFLGGKRYEHLIERDGKPLPPHQAEREQAKIDKAAAEADKLTDAERDRRWKDYERERAKQHEIAHYLLDAYSFQLVGEPVLNGRPCWLMEASPRSFYHGKYANILTRMRGRIWIDKADYEWAKVDAQVLDDISFGWFLAKLSKGATFTVERTRVNDEVWLPKYIRIRFAARALWEHANQEETVAYSNYRKFTSESHLVGDVEESK